MSDAFAALPWQTRWWTHMKMMMPRWYQNWRCRRQFWEYATQGAKGGSTARDYLIRMFACAELNRRNGDESLHKILQKRLPGAQITLEEWRIVKASPPVTLRMNWVDNKTNAMRRMPWE